MVLFAVNLSAEIMHLEIKRPIDDATKVVRINITLTSINKQEVIFFIDVSPVLATNLNMTLGNGSRSNTKDRLNLTIKNKNDYTANIKHKEFPQKAQKFMPLGLKVKDFFDPDRVTDTYIKWLDVDLVRNFLIKGLDENGFELKSTNHYIGKTTGGFDESITNFWFQK